MGYAQRAARAWAGLATAVAGLSVVAVFGLATPAAADVTIDSEQGHRLGGARVAFRVTNEHPTLPIVKVEVRFPADLRVPEVYPIAVPDWAPSTMMAKVDDNPGNDVPTAITWITMPGKEIKPGGTSVLPLAMGPMPDREAVYFDVVQTRSDGSTETWAGADTPAAGAQHPAFKIELVPIPPGHAPAHGDAAATDVPQTDVAADPVAEDPDSTEGSGPVRLALVLLVIAALTVFALYWQRRRSAQSGDGDRAEGAASAARVPFQPRNSAPAKAAAVTKSAPAKSATITKVKAADVAPPDDEPGPAVAVQRRSVVRAAAARKASARRTVVRKSTGGAGTVTMPRQRANASERAVDSAGDNA